MNLILFLSNMYHLYNSYKYNILDDFKKIECSLLIHPVFAFDDGFRRRNIIQFIVHSS